MRRLLELLFPPKSPSAAIARERLKIVLAHERVNQDAPDFLPVLQKELLDVVSRYIEIRPEMIHINLGKSGGTSLLEINVELDGGKIKLDKTVAAARPAPAHEPKPALARAFEAGEPAPWVKPG
ncbi:MAG: cell division topological specificity factor MinE [Stellaceae bacterium]